MSKIASIHGVSRGAIAGKLSRMKLLGEKSRQAAVTRPNDIDTGCTTWDRRVFQPWSERRAVRQIERNRGLPFRSLDGDISRHSEA